MGVTRDSDVPLGQGDLLLLSSESPLLRCDGMLLLLVHEEEGGGGGGGGGGMQDSNLQPAHQILP